MEITEVRLIRFGNESKLKAMASITIDGAFVVKGLRVIEGKNGIFVAMPSRQVSEGRYEDIAFPITAEAREMVIKAVLDKYNEGA